MSDELEIEELLAKIEGPQAPDDDLEARIWAKVSPHLEQSVADGSTFVLAELARKGEYIAAKDPFTSMKMPRVAAAAVLVVLLALAALVLRPGTESVSDEVVQLSPVERIEAVCLETDIATASHDLAESISVDGRPPAATIIGVVETDIELVLAELRAADSAESVSQLAALGDRLEVASDLAQLVGRQLRSGDLIAARATSDALSATLSGALDSLADLGAPACARSPNPGG